MKMRKNPPLREIIEKNILSDSNWVEYLNNDAPLPIKNPGALEPFAIWLLYLGKNKQAKELCYKFSVFLEERAKQNKLLPLSMHDYLKSSLFRSLAGYKNEANTLWSTTIDISNQISDKDIINYRAAEIWVFEAYGLAKLNKYELVNEFALKGFKAINKNKSPHNHTAAYGLADLIIKLADYKINSIEENKKKAQKSLLVYKRENIRHGRLGYGYIFDIQNSYPDVFTQVLPSNDTYLD